MIDFLKPLLDEERKLEFVDLFPINQTQYKYKNIFDSVLYRVQLNKSMIFKINDFNKISDDLLSSSMYSELNLKNRNYKGINIIRQKEER